MKKFMTTLLAATLAVSGVAAPAIAAPGHGNSHSHSQMDHWKKGERFDSRKASHYQVVDYRQHRGMKAPPRGYRYVRSGDDILLVGISTGIVASVLADSFR